MFRIKLLAGSLALLASATAHAQASKTFKFDEAPGPATFTAYGVEITMQPRKETDDLIEVAAAVRVPGYQSIIVDEEGGSSPFYARWVGIGKLSSTDPVPSVLFEGFTGGAHCCATLKAVVPNAGKLKAVEFEPVDGDSDKLFPKDVDGDGTVDIVRQDDNFRYQFASGAGSFSPPVIFNIFKGQIIDVSTQPAFAELWEAFAKKTRAGCVDRSDEDRNGACAAYVAASARLGRYDPAMKEVERFAIQTGNITLPSRCAVPLVGEQCPAGKDEKFYTFSSALRWFLKDRGYID